MKTRFAAIILAAGKGTRMKSDMAKVLHVLAGKPLIHHVVKVACEVVGERVFVVLGHQADRVRDAVAGNFRVRFSEQRDQLGTGHAAACAMDDLDPDVTDVLILCGDVPLLKAATLRELIAYHNRQKNDITLLATDVAEAAGYGRLVIDGSGTVVEIVEEADADQQQKRIRTINAGVYCMRIAPLADGLKALRPDNAQGEYYLTDLVRIGHQRGWRIGAFPHHDPKEILGINTPGDLAAAESAIGPIHAKPLD